MNKTIVTGITLFIDQVAAVKEIKISDLYQFTNPFQEIELISKQLAGISGDYLELTEIIWNSMKLAGN